MFIELTESGNGVTIGSGYEIYFIISNRLGIMRHNGEWYYRFGRDMPEVKCEFDIGCDSTFNNDEIAKLLLYKEEKALLYVYDYVEYGYDDYVIDYYCDGNKVTFYGLEFTVTDDFAEILSTNSKYINSLRLSFVHKAASIQPVLTKSANN